MGPRFIHDFAEVQLAADDLAGEPTELPPLLARLVAPAFDRTVEPGAAPWPVTAGPVHRRHDGWVYPVRWPGGRGGLVPAVEADLGLYPMLDGAGHLELLGTYTPSRRARADRSGRQSHVRTVRAVRRLVESLATGLSVVEPIAIGPAPPTRSVGR